MSSGFRRYKNSSFCAVSTLLCFLLSIFSSSAFAENCNTIQSGAKKRINNFSLRQARTLLRSGKLFKETGVQKNVEVTFRFGAHASRYSYTPVSIFADHKESKTTRNHVYTFQGNRIGSAKQEISALTLTIPKKHKVLLRGLNEREHSLYTIEAANFCQKRIRNKRNQIDFEQHLDSARQIQKAPAEPKTQAATSIPIIEIATSADYELVTQYGGALGANSYIINVLNSVDAIYRRDLGIGVKISDQFAWIAEDPVTLAGSDHNAALNRYANFYYFNFRTTVHYDIALLFTGRNYGGSGAAIQNGICHPDYQYGIISTFSYFPTTVFLAAHEAGHLIGGQHLENCGLVANYNFSIMCPGAPRSGDIADSLYFTAVSYNQIQSTLAYLNTVEPKCLMTKEQLQTPTPTATRTATKTQTPTRTATATSTASATETAEPTSTSTNTATPTATPSATRTAIRTATSTRTSTATATQTKAPIHKEPTATRTATATQTATSTKAPPPTATNTVTASATATFQNTATFTATATRTATLTATASNTATIKATNTSTPTATQTATASASSTATTKATNTTTPTQTATTRPSLTATATMTATASRTSTARATPTLTATTKPSLTATSTATSRASSTSTPAATQTSTLRPSITATASATNTSTPTQTATATATLALPNNPEQLAVTPILECITEDSNQMYTAYFGYESLNTSPVTLNLPSQNTLSAPETTIATPALFSPGRRYGVLAVRFKNQPVQWTLAANINSPRSAIATSASPRCKPVTPSVSCINPTSSFISATFGYNNQNLFDLRIEIGDKNFFTPGELNRGQPQLFKAGNNPSVFSINFDQSLPIEWNLAGLTSKAKIEDRLCNLPEGCLLSFTSSGKQSIISILKLIKSNTSRLKKMLTSLVSLQTKSTVAPQNSKKIDLLEANILSNLSIIPDNIVSCPNPPSYCKSSDYYPTIEQITGSLQKQLSLIRRTHARIMKSDPLLLSELRRLKANRFLRSMRKLNSKARILANSLPRSSLECS